MNETYVIKYNDCAVSTLTQHSHNMDEASSNRHIARLSKDNVAQVVVLEVLPEVVRSARVLGSEASYPGGVQICVVNTHLYSNHMFPDVKLWQTVSLMQELEVFITQRDLPVVLCGDFNSEPQSAVYQYLSEGGLDVSHPDLENVSDKMLPGLESSTHSVELVSAMNIAYGEEPNFTNYTAGFQGTLDYMWFNPTRLRAAAVAEIPAESSLEGTLPNAVYPSDHFFLCCEFLVSTSASSMSFSAVNSPPPVAAPSAAATRSTRRQYSSPSPPVTVPGSKPKISGRGSLR